MSDYYIWIYSQLTTTTTQSTAIPVTTNPTNNSGPYECGLTYFAPNSRIVGGSTAHVNIFNY